MFIIYYTLALRKEIAMAELEMLHQEKVLNENDVSDLFITLSRLKDEYGRQAEILGAAYYLNNYET